MQLKDKVVVITGGSKGFGLCLAKDFLGEGSRVVICAREESVVDDVAREIGALGLVADVTKEEELENLAEEVLKQHGRIDIWVNNAGIFRERKNIEDMDMSEVREMYEVNVFGVMHGTRVALRKMKKDKTGTIVNVISSAALSGRPMISSYASSKWAANGFTESTREENKDAGISVFSVFPGGMKTELFGDEKSEDYNDYKTPEEVSKKVVENLKSENPEIHLIITRNPVKWLLS